MKQAITQYLMVKLLVVGAYFLGVYKTRSEMLAKAPAQVAQVGTGAQQPTTPATVDVEAIKASLTASTSPLASQMPTQSSPKYLTHRVPFAIWQEA